MNHKTNYFDAIRVAAVGMAVLAMPAAVAAADAGALEACQSIKDDAERLACFDAALSPEPAPAVEALPKEAAAPPETTPEPEPPAAVEAQPVEKPPAAPAPAPEPARKAEPAAQPGVLTDEIGRESVSNADRDSLAVRGKLVRCDQGRSRKFVFYFDNGQVWRQRGNARVTWKECDFEVTISKDVFGYTMVRDGEKRKVRIERVK